MDGNDWNSDRMYVEQQKLKTNFSQFHFKGKDGIIFAIEGDFRISSQIWGIRIEIPSNYPNELPEIRTLGWSIDGECPHIYGNNIMCVCTSSQWSRTLTLAWLVSKSALWVNKYIIWKQKGIWPGREQHH